MEAAALAALLGLRPTPSSASRLAPCWPQALGGYRCRCGICPHRLGAETLDRIERGQAANKSLSDLGGAAGDILGG
jgi:hypothetical protein